MARNRIDDWVNNRLGRPRGRKVNDRDRIRAGLVRGRDGEWRLADDDARPSRPPRPRYGGQRTRTPNRTSGGGSRGDTNPRHEPRPPFPTRPTYVGRNTPWQYEHSGEFTAEGVGTVQVDEFQGRTQAQQDSYFYNALYVRGGPFANQSPGNGEIAMPSTQPRNINIATFVNGIKRMTETELIQFQRDLVDLGIMAAGSFDWGVLDMATQSAAETFFVEARQAGVPIEEYAKMGGGIDDDIVAGGEPVDISQEEVSLSDPDSIIANGQTVAQELLGRDLTEDEKMRLVGRVHEGERSSQMDAINQSASAEAQAASLAGTETSAGASGTEVDRFMAALAGKESGGNPNAVNADSGAAGTFQIMPGNWERWAREAGVDPADKSPQNQYKVARMKIMQYYREYGNWRDVAVAWYSGDVSKRYSKVRQGGGKYPSISDYADDVIARMGNTSNNPDGSTKGGVVIGTPYETTQFDSNAEAEKLLKESDPKGWAAHRVFNQFDAFTSMIGEL